MFKDLNKRIFKDMTKIQLIIIIMNTIIMFPMLLLSLDLVRYDYRLTFYIFVVFIVITMPHWLYKLIKR